MSEPMSEPTGEIDKLKELWQDGEVKEYWLQTFVLVTAILVGLRLFLTTIRQRTGHTFIKYTLQATYYLSGHALSYVLGLLSNPPISNGLVVVWAVFLVIFSSSAENLGSQSLADNEARRERFLWDYMLPSLWSLSIFLFYIEPSGLVWIPLLLLWILYFLKLREWKVGLISACRTPDGIDRVLRVVVEFMKYEHEESLNGADEPNPTTMQGYKYLVGLKEAIAQDLAASSPVFPRPADKRRRLDLTKIATVEKIWQCEGRLLSGSKGEDLKDTCLSFALFWILLRRFADYELDELYSVESREKMWKLVSKGLIKEQQDGKEFERAFRVVETELDFLYDYFYNNYYATYSTGGVRLLLLRLLVVVLYFVVSFVVLKHIVPEKKSSPWYNMYNLQIHVTRALIWVLTVVELAQIAIMITSKWLKVKWICRYVQSRSWETRQGKFEEKLLSILCHAPCFGPWFKPWRRKLRQYSLLKSFGHTPLLLHFKWVLDGYMDLPMMGQKESKSVKLSPEVIKSVIESLRTNGQTLSNGVASLRRNQVEDSLSWACDSNKMISHVLLVWHIATSICEIRSNTTSSGLSDATNVNIHIATSLSSYCAYLVVLAPDLLPDHTYLTRCLFEQVVFEARVVLKGCDSEERKYQTLMDLSEQNNGVSVLEEGASLGKQLMEGIVDPGDRWKVLADFWAEMILFLAPSDYAASHAAYLTVGGEFLTHLWALLTHAGLVDRKSNNDTERQQTRDAEA